MSIQTQTLYDGDALFTLAAGASDGPAVDLTVIGVAATDVVAEAVVAAINPRIGM